MGERRRLGSLFVTLIVMLVLSVPAVAFGAPTLIDDAAFTYGGGAWSVFSDPEMSGGSNHYTAVTGAYGDATFTGTEVTFISTTGPNRGLVRIYLDGVDQGTVDEYSPGLQYRRRLWSMSGLSSAAHTLRVVHAGPGGSLGGPYVEIDAIEYDNVPPVVSTTSSSWWSVPLLFVAAIGMVVFGKRKLLSRGD